MWRLAGFELPSREFPKVAVLLLLRPTPEQPPALAFDHGSDYSSRLHCQAGGDGNREGDASKGDGHRIERGRKPYPPGSTS